MGSASPRSQDLPAAGGAVAIQARISWTNRMSMMWLSTVAEPGWGWPSSAASSRTVACSAAVAWVERT
jgi:hypothetical protein